MFHNNLKSLRAKSGLSQRQIADYLSVSPQSVSKWEKGEALPSIDYLPGLAECLGCDINAFFIKEKKALISYGIIEPFFNLMIEVLNETKKLEDVKAFVAEHTYAVDMAEKVCANLMLHQTVNVKSIQGILDCNEAEARVFMEHLQRCEMIEKLNVDGIYYVKKDAVEGFVMLIKMQQRVCDILNDLEESNTNR